MNIDTIFDNIDQYTNNIDDLVNALKQVGVNNFSEFKMAQRDAGVPVRKSIQDQLEAKFAEPAHSSLEETDWEEALCLNTAEAYQKYLDSYPEGDYRGAARELLSRLQSNTSTSYSQPVNPSQKKISVDQLAKEIKKIKTNKSINDPEQAICENIINYLNAGNITKDELLSAIKDDNNFLSGAVTKLLIDNNQISVDDLLSIGIDEVFIDFIQENKKVENFSSSASSVEKITMSPCTEFYFWGIPSSGKSCALGAIISCAKSGNVAFSFAPNPNCQGYGYMTRLSNIFKRNGDVGRLPVGNAISATYEMGFDLVDDKKRKHPITCVDLAGELIRCMYKSDAQEPLTEEEQSVLGTLTSIMSDNRTGNRKIHYFVIEYGAEDREYEGLGQEVYLDAAVAYINRTGIFRKDTDAIYILISKVDKAKATGRELQEKLRDYMLKYYRGFYNGLTTICADNEINGGEVEIQPFTLGTVCFEHYCKFKEDSAAQVVKTILDRSWGESTGKWAKLKNKLRD